jgi:hypothetical protein
MYVYNTPHNTAKLVKKTVLISQQATLKLKNSKTWEEGDLYACVLKVCFQARRKDAGREEIINV